MTVAILCTRLNMSNIRIYFWRKSLITHHVNEVSSTYQIFCLNVYVLTTYYNFSLIMISLKHIKTAA